MDQMNRITCFDNNSSVSDLTDNSDSSGCIRVEDITSKLRNDLSKLNMEVLKDKCKEIGLSGISKLNKPDLIQMLETEFLKMYTYLNTKNKDELKILGKSCDVKKLSTSKKDYIVYHILLYHANHMIFKCDIIYPISKPFDIKIQMVSSKIEAPLSDPIKEETRRRIIEEEETRRRIIEEEETRRRIIEEEETRRRIIEEEETRRRIIEEEETRRILKEEKKESKQKKQSIPKSVKTSVWNNYIGEDIIKHKCLCCKKVNITNTTFDVGHVISEKDGGTHEINNLRPICPACNHSMGTENMIDFVKKYGYYIG
jgi:5-methylcytosine-specific restriction endonuclease McrA